MKIEKVVLGFNNAKNEYLFEKYLNYRIAEVIYRYSENRPTLIFCQTQKGTINAAQQLLLDKDKIFRDLDLKYYLDNDLKNKIKDKQLAALVSNGIAFHNAGLSLSDRQLVEEGFKKGSSILFL